MLNADCDRIKKMSVPRKNQIDRGARGRPAAGAALAARRNFGLRLVRNSRGSVAVNDGRKQGLPVNYEKCRVRTGAWRRWN